MPIADHRAIRSGFRLCDDGDVVAFSYQEWGKALATFAIAERALVLGGEASAALSAFPGRLTVLRPPRLDGLSITDWTNNTAPKLRGQVLKLANYEISRSLAVAPNAAFFLLGADWNLRCFAPDGTQHWQQHAPGVVWAVNLSSDGRIAVAAYGDGTIRWHDVEHEGRELLAFFPHADRKRWVLWTPEGYFDCSPGAEDLIGWHLNRGKDKAADFYSVGQFWKAFYRPDVISRVLKTRDVKAALEEANAARAIKTEAGQPSLSAIMERLPPVVELSSGGMLRRAENSQANFPLAFRVRQGGKEPVTGVAVLLDGRPMDVHCPVPASDDEEVTVQVPVPPRDCVLAVVAENKSFTSQAEVVNVTWKGEPAPPRKPRLHLLAVGVSELRNQKSLGLEEIEYADDDARALAAAFQRQQGGLYSEVTTRVLADREATSAAVREGLEWLTSTSSTEDVAALFIAGHGVNVGGADSRFYFCPHDFDNADREGTGVSFDRIITAIGKAKGRTLVFLDTCHAANALGKGFAAHGGLVDHAELSHALSSVETSAVLFASSSGWQPSLESDEYKGGLFTKALVEGLDAAGTSTGKGGAISATGLGDYVAGRVARLSNGLQTPFTSRPATMPDFTLALPVR